MDIDIIWKNIKHYEGETFKTITGKTYAYEVFDNYLVVKDRIGARITRLALEKALAIEKPSLQDLNDAGIKRANSYVYGIITDERIGRFK